MSNSSLVSYTKISPNSNSPRNHVIDTATIHCFVGQVSIESMGNYFASKSNKCSANYGIGSDGRIGLFVEEKSRSWCSSSKENDNRAITIECACDSFHPYKVNDAVMTSLIELIADICKRNGIKELKWKADKSLIGQVDKQNMTVHRWFKNKACPGDYLYNKHLYIAEEVNKKINGNVAPVQPASAPQPIQPAERYQVGKVYVVAVNQLRVRTGPGTSATIKVRKDLTLDGQKHADQQGRLNAGTAVQCLEIRKVGNDIWIRIPSGWIAAQYQGKEYVR